MHQLCHHIKSPEQIHLHHHQHNKNDDMCSLIWPGQASGVKLDENARIPEQASQSCSKCAALILMEMYRYACGYVARGNNNHNIDAIYPHVFDHLERCNIDGDLGLSCHGCQCSLQYADVYLWSNFYEQKLWLGLAAKTVAIDELKLWVTEDGHQHDQETIKYTTPLCKACATQYFLDTLCEKKCGLCRGSIRRCAITDLSMCVTRIDGNDYYGTWKWQDLADSSESNRRPGSTAAASVDAKGWTSPTALEKYPWLHGGDNICLGCLDLLQKNGEIIRIDKQPQDPLAHGIEWLEDPYDKEFSCHDCHAVCHGKDKCFVDWAQIYQDGKFSMGMNGSWQLKSANAVMPCGSVLCPDCIKKYDYEKYLPIQCVKCNHKFESLFSNWTTECGDDCCGYIDERWISYGYGSKFDNSNLKWAARFKPREFPRNSMLCDQCTIDLIERGVIEYNKNKWWQK